MTTLITTMQYLADNPWEKNAFPVIQEGKIVKWDPYYFSAHTLRVHAYRAKSSLDYDTVERLHKKIDHYAREKITGERIICQAFKDDRFYLSNDRIAIYKKSEKKDLGEVFSFPLAIGKVLSDNSPEIKEYLDKDERLIPLESITEKTRNFLMTLVRTPFVEGQLVYRPTKRLVFKDGAELILPEYYIEALKQDSEVFDKCFSKGQEVYELDFISKEDLELVINFTYKAPQKERFNFKVSVLSESLRIGKLTRDLKLKQSNEDLNQTMFQLIATHIESTGNDALDMLCKAYDYLQSVEYYAANEILLKYFSNTVSALPLEQFNQDLKKLAKVGVSTFRLKPSKDGSNDKRVSSLIQLMPNLLSLDLCFMDNLPSDACSTIGKMPKLRWLFLNSAQFVTDDMLCELAQAKTLENLILSGESITNEGLKHIATMKSMIQFVILKNDKITDVGVRHLFGMPALKSVGLNSSLISEKALKELKGQLVTT